MIDIVILVSFQTHYFYQLWFQEHRIIIADLLAFITVVSRQRYGGDFFVF